MAEQVGFRQAYRRTGKAEASQGIGSNAGTTQSAGKSGVPSTSFNKEIKIPKGGAANTKEAK